MRQRIRARIAGLLFLFYAAPLHAQIPAFPGAEGFGAVSVGGRGGDVYHVISLADTNTLGTLRHAISSAPAAGRIIVFDVSGNIQLTSDLSVNKAKITIAGQTAPGQGITVHGDSMWLENNDLVVRYIRSRLTSTGGTQDSLSIQNGNRVIMDHVSASWSADEVTSMTNNSSNNTIQWSFITEALNSQNHSRASLFRPGANVPMGTAPHEFNLSVHHSLYAHTSDRNPVFSTYNEKVLNADFRNNVVFDWRNQASHTGESNAYVSLNFVGNFYVAGLTTRADLVANPKIYSADGPRTTMYHSDNRVDATRDDGLHNGIYLASSVGGGFVNALTPFNYPAVTTESSSDAYDSVLQYSGSFWWNRDPVDERVVTDVHEISDPNASVRAQSGTMLTTEASVGGLPVLPIETRAANWDTDLDGMPDHWEVAHGLNPHVGGAAQYNGDFDSDGYTNVEEYINEVGAFPCPEPISFDGSVSDRYARAENWHSNWQPSHFDTVRIPTGAVVVDAVGQHAGDLHVAPDAGNVASLSISGGWLEVKNDLAIAPAGDDGELSLTGGKLRVGTLSKGVNGEFLYSGGTLAADLVDFDLLNNGGTIAPGDSAGQTLVDGALTINAGVLDVELENVLGGILFDQLLVSGNVQLGGTLDVSTLGSPVLTPGMTFEIIDVGGLLSGQFDGLAEGDLVGNFGEDVYITYTAGDGNDVALFTGIPGDFDFDQDVDGVDFLIWQRGESPLNGSPAELEDWEENYGTAPGLSAMTESVPEPGGMMLVGGLIATLFGRFPRDSVRTMGVP